MAQHGTIRNAPPAGRSAAIPDKLYFRIGEVAKLCGVAAYVLRFWESEFPQLKPHKGGTGQRLYRKRDVEMALRIKTLLYDEGFTIPGARQALKGEQKQKEPQMSLGIAEPVESGPASNDKRLKKLQKDLRELHAMLSVTPTAKPVHTMRPARTPKPVPPSIPTSDDLFN